MRLIRSDGGTSNGESHAQSIASGHRFVFERVGKSAQQANALATDSDLLARIQVWQLGRTQRIKAWRFIVYDENKVPLPRHREADDHGAIRLGSIAMTDDIRDHFLQAKIHCELDVNRNGVRRRQNFDPRGKLRDIGKPAPQSQLIPSLVCAVHSHSAPRPFRRAALGLL